MTAKILPPHLKFKEFPRKVSIGHSDRSATLPASFYIYLTPMLLLKASKSVICSSRYSLSKKRFVILAYYSLMRMRTTGALKLRRGLLWKTCEISRSTVPRVKASSFVKREMFRFVFVDLTWSCSSLKYSRRMTGTSLTIRLHPFMEG